MPDAPADRGNPTDEDRDRYLRLIDNARDRGLLDIEEHAKRVVAIGAARSLDELNDIVWQLPVMQGPAVQRQTRGAAGQSRQPQVSPLPITMDTAPTTGNGRGTVVHDRSAQSEPSAPADLPPLAGGGPDGMRRLDPVDVAMLHLRSTAKKPEPARRWAALVVVALMFIVLIALGVVLAAHSHSSSGSNGGLTRPGPSYSAPASPQ